MSQDCVFKRVNLIGAPEKDLRDFVTRTPPSLHFNHYTRNVLFTLG